MYLALKMQRRGKERKTETEQREGFRLRDRTEAPSGCSVFASLALSLESSKFFRGENGER